MTTTLTEKARELLDGRIKTAEELGVARDNLAAVEQRHRSELDAAQRQFSAAYSAATSAGWSDRELRELGVQKPAAKKGGRPRGSRTTRTPAQKQPQVQETVAPNAAE